MAADGQKIIKRLGELRTLRAIHEKAWQDCFDMTYPLRGNGLQSTQLSAVDAQAKRAELFDSTGTDSVRVLASAIMSGLTPANSRWFQLDVGEETDDEKRWLDESATILWENIHASNFDSAGFEACIDLVCCGWFAMFIEAKEEGGFHFQQWPISSIFCASTKPSGLIDVLYRPFELTAEQAVAEYGDVDQQDEMNYGVSDKIKTLAKEKPDDKIQFVQAIYPRDEYKEGGKRSNQLPYASCTVEVATGKLVREKGYHEKPFIVPRWMLIPSSVYGIGPVYDALPDIKTLNALCKMELASADRAINGDYVVEDDGVINPRNMVQKTPGGMRFIVASSTDSIKALPASGNFNISFTMKAELQTAIRKILMADQLQPQDGPSMTATEVHVRVNMIRQLLGPVYGRFQAEYLQPLIERCFSVAYRAGIFNMPPESLANREFTVKYISPLARAQKLEEVGAIERLYGQAANMVQVRGNLDVLDNVDDDEAFRLTAEALGAPSKILVGLKDVQAMRESRAQAQAEMKQEAQMQPMMEEAGKALINSAVPT